MDNKRVQKLAQHLQGGSPSGQGLSQHNTASQRQVFGAVGTKNDDDVVIVSALRTPIAKARKGGFKNTTPDNLLVAVLKGVIDQSKIDPKEVQDVAVGNVQLSGAYALPARTAMFRAGIPDSASVRAVNRQCSSGLEAISNIATQIKTGMIDCGIGAGVESMTLGGNPGDPSNIPPMDLNEIFQTPGASDCLTPMGMTSEAVAEKFGITREKQDQMAVDSHAKALKAQAEGWFKNEIVPVEVTVEDAEGNEKEVVIEKDEGPRAGTTLEGLAKLKPAFKKGGSTTAGNSSQVSDGAAAALLMTRQKAKQLGLPILGVFRGAKVVGVPPAIMGIGPAAAIPACLADTGLTVDDIDIFEINEAFASQATYCVEELKVPKEKLNPVGGGLSLGHPLGATGARMTATALHGLKRTGGKTAIVSMCIGTGMGMSALLEAE